MTVTEIPDSGGPHLFAEILPETRPAPPVVLVGHSDTVWPQGEASRHAPSERGGRLYGPGVYDMRGGLVLAVFALRFLRDSGERLARPLQVFLAADEEVGSKTAHPHMERLLAPEATALVLEPPLENGSVKIQRKGVSMYRIEAHGVESHAGSAPERGASAIVEIANQLLEVIEFSDPRRGITVNIGTIEGGVATNVVAGFSSAGVDVRFDRLEDGEEIERRLRALGPRDPRVQLRVEGGILFPPVVPDDRSRNLASTTIRLAKELGLQISAGKSGGGSDGNFLAAKGLAVLDGLGAEGAGAHARDEHVVIDRLPVRAALLATLLLERC
jgi:glutamate carboxypeptidase